VQVCGYFLGVPRRKVKPLQFVDKGSLSPAELCCGPQSDIQGQTAETPKCKDKLVGQKSSDDGLWWRHERKERVGE
jgi:hypothetical protein